MNEQHWYIFVDKSERNRGHVVGPYYVENLAACNLAQGSHEIRGPYSMAVADTEAVRLRSIEVRP